VHVCMLGYVVSRHTVNDYYQLVESVCSTVGGRLALQSTYARVRIPKKNKKKHKTSCCVVMGGLDMLWGW